MEKEKTKLDILIDIQTRLKAPKDQKNSFGGYNYRSCEDILTALKPILAEHKCAILFDDKIESVNGRFYITAEAKLCTPLGDICAHAYAREQETKKGYDEAQITGAASSYARKYALNALFAIDDTRDPDTQDNTKEGLPQENNANRIPDFIVNKIANAKSVESLSEIWQTTTTFHNNATFKQLMSQRKHELQDVR